MEAVIRFIREEKLLSLQSPVLVAISGGRDSVCLAHLLHTNGYTIALAHVNYGLRGQASEDDEAFVRDLGLQWNIKTHVKRVEPGSVGPRSLQETARNIRYAFFSELVEQYGYSAIATAHHRDDRIETLFLNLLRGTGIHGLKGIPARRGNIVRPLLYTSRKDIDLYLRQHGLTYRDDVSNESDRYTRNRVRHHLVPLLEEIDPEATGKLDRSLTHLAKDADAVAEMAAALVEKTEDGWLINLRTLPGTTHDTWCYHCLRPFGFNRQQAADIAQTATSGKFIGNSEFTAVRKGDLVIVRTAGQTPARTWQIPGPGVYDTGKQTLQITLQPAQYDKMPRDNSSVWLDASRLQFPLTLRAWKHGDRFQPLGCDYEVKISDYLTDRKVDRIAKQSVLVLCDAQEKVLWIVDHQVADAVKIDVATREIYCCTIA